MQVKYVTHKCIPIADCMSRLVNLKSGIKDPTLNLQIADVTKTNVNWNQIKLSCLENPTMIQLARIIQRGWPDTVKQVPVDVKPYFQYRYILHHFSTKQNCHSHGSVKHFSPENPWCSLRDCKVEIAWPDTCLLAQLEQWRRDDMPKLYFVQRKPIYAGKHT